MLIDEMSLLERKYIRYGLTRARNAVYVGGNIIRSTYLIPKLYIFYVDTLITSCA